MGVRSGITSKTPERFFIDAGAVYLNYGLVNERLLGATRGGNEFNLNRVTRAPEVDGLKGPVKGMTRVTEVRPQITANLIELTVENLIAAIAGANQSDQIDIKVEHVGAGDAGGTKEFDLDQKPVLENSEKIYVQASADGAMVLKARSKKYSSRFVGAKAANNKGFIDGLGDWAKGGTGEIALATEGQSGNCLQYTAAATALAEFLKLDGKDGAILTNLIKDKYYRLQIAIKADDSWNGTAIKVACGGVVDAISIPDPKDTAWTVYVVEFKATGTDATIKLTADSAPTAGVLCIDSLELEEVDGDYVMNWVEGKVYFKTAPGENYDIIASYTYTSGSAVDTTITGGEIGDEDYIDNVAIVGNMSGKNYPVICIVENALADTGFSISTAPRDEAVPAIVFTGHYDPSDLDTEPWKVRYPKT